jgi:hypothetical protein
LISGSRDELLEALDQIGLKIPTGMNNRIRTLIGAVFPSESVSGRMLGLRGKFAHESGHKQPSADEVEEVHRVVCACLDYRFKELQKRVMTGPGVAGA